MMSPLQISPQHQVPLIPGLFYFPDFVSQEEANALIREIDKRHWLSSLKRRVQHYGYRYDYRARETRQDSFLGPLPEWLDEFSEKISRPAHLGTVPDQAIINEYVPGQGISRHVDCVPCFGPRIAILSLGSSCIMQFSHAQAAVTESVVLKERSLLVLSEAARYEWQHAIPARKSDVVDGIRIARARRLSVTLRTVMRSGQGDPLQGEDQVRCSASR